MAGGVGSGRDGSGSGRGKEGEWGVVERVVRIEGNESGRGRSGGSGRVALMTEERCLS